ncbi:MAG TPA: uroporphyrinogen-III C-methyltransferase [Herpetosiphonaceae bacterium]|nr:uroporphyrinogen-III C-methyltransferase [Herpetosiphonaceae bacterium]
MSPEARGLISLIGAGPGDPGLITVKGMQRLQQADAVVYDWLANDELLSYAPAYAERHYVGKQPGACQLSQAAISALLVDLGRQGKRVVRLKGGDPYIFGRGGEEAAALQAAGIAWEIVPGVSSGIAAPAYAGIAVTHRDCASSVALVTGHEDPNRVTTRVNWEGLARSVDTIVIYMGVGNLRQIGERLIAGGRSPATSVAAIRWGTLECQQTVVGTLATIAKDVATAGLTSPVIVVVGDVVGLRDHLRWYDGAPGCHSDADRIEPPVAGDEEQA